jgi:hypothetical protein
MSLWATRLRPWRYGCRLTIAVFAWSLAAPPTSSGQSTSPILVDRHMTLGAGATVAAAVGELVARGEDAIVPHRLFAERGMSKRTTNVVYRLFKVVLFDLPQENVLLVVNHEVFGHGARLRERFDASIDYRIDLPGPYGDGGGATSFGLRVEPTTAEWLAVRGAGMEADGVAAGLIAQRAFVARGMRPRDAMRYLAFELDTLDYVLGTGDGPEETGHDVFGLLEDYNTAARAAGAREVSAKDLRREVLVGLANPMLAYAIVGVGRYIWNGANTVAVPALDFAGVRYLPYMRYRLTPFGTEWAVINELAGRIRPLQLEVRVGRSPNATPFGFGVRRVDLATIRQWRVDAAVELWRQPPIDAESLESIAGAQRWGSEVRGRVERPLNRTRLGDRPLSLIVDVGLKTQGFVAGEPMGAGLVARAGVGIPWR